MTVLDRLEILSRGTDILFHWTMFRNALEILTSSKFNMNTAQGTISEKLFSKENFNYYLSTTRTKVGGYHIGNKTIPQVMFNLNGRAISMRPNVIIRPLEYWNNLKQKQTWLQMQESGQDIYPEMEDRILSREPYLPANNKYILSVHVLIPELEKIYKYFKKPNEPDEYKISENNVKMSRMAMNIISTAKKAGINAFFYTKHNDWLTQNPLKRVPILSMKKYFKSVAKPEQAGEYERLKAIQPKSERGATTFYALRELLNKKDKKELSKSGIRVLNTIMCAWNIREAVISIQSDIHNYKQIYHKEIIAVENDMRKFSLSSVTELVTFIRNKWNNPTTAAIRVEAKKELNKEKQTVLTSKQIDGIPVSHWQGSKLQWQDILPTILENRDWLKFYARLDWNNFNSIGNTPWFDKQKMQFTFYDVPAVYLDSKERKLFPDREIVKLKINGKPTTRTIYSNVLPIALKLCRKYVLSRSKFIRENKDYLDKTVYIRYGDWPEHGKSKNHLVTKETGKDVWENGLSVYHCELDIDAGHWEIELSINEDTISGTLSSLYHSNRPIYLVAGEEIGEGSDGEPLLKNVKVLKKLRKDEVKVSGVFDD